MCEPLVSVIMPVYNVEDYLEESLNSIFNQKYKNIELIAINDGSTDSSGSILKDNKNKHNLKSFRIYEQVNKGLSITRNVGLSMSTGEYVYFFDSDDLLDENTISDLVNFVKYRKVDIVRFNADVFFDKAYSDTSFSPSSYSKGNLISNTLYTRDEFILLQDSVPSSVCIYFYSSKLLKENKIFFYPDILHEDELFTPIVLFYSERIGYLDSAYFKRRYRHGSIMTTKNSLRDNSVTKKHGKGYFTVISELSRFKKENKLTSAYSSYIDNIIIRIGNMIFLSRGLNSLDNIKLLSFGIKPFESIKNKIYARLKNN